jgi:hypothetical protein
MARRILVIATIALITMGSRYAHAQIVVHDAALTFRNTVIATLKSQLLGTLTEEADRIQRMARRLSTLTSLDKYAVPDPTRWRSYRYQDINLYANAYADALDLGDADGTAYESVARGRQSAQAALAQLGEDEPAAEGAILSWLATLDLADSTVIVGTDQNGRLRANGRLEMRAVDELERDATDPSPTQSATAILDKLSGAVLLGTRNRDARTQFVSAVVEQLLIDNKRARDAEAAAMNMQLGRLRDGRAAATSVVAGAASDLRTWRQP